MSELVINFATCSWCGHAGDDCTCATERIDSQITENVEERDDYLPLPEPVVNVASQVAVRRNDDLLIPPPVTEILVNERRAELAKLGQRQGTENWQRSSDHSERSNVTDNLLTYPML